MGSLSTTAGASTLGFVAGAWLRWLGGGGRVVFLGAAARFSSACALGAGGGVDFEAGRGAVVTGRGGIEAREPLSTAMLLLKGAAFGLRGASAVVEVFGVGFFGGDRFRFLVSDRLALAGRAAARSRRDAASGGRSSRGSAGARGIEGVGRGMFGADL
jgi:hypothetical protein